MQVELGAVVVYDSVLYNRTGQVRRWADALNARFVLNAKNAAPMRSGELRAGISGEVTRIGPRHLQTVIESAAPHSLYVLRGTTGPIMSRRMWGFSQKFPHLIAPRGAMFFGSNVAGSPSQGRINMQWMRENGYALRLRPGKGFGTTYALAVSGQEANNFFGVAADRTAVRHPSLRGFSPGYGY